MTDEQKKIVRDAITDRLLKLKREVSLAESALREFNGETAVKR